MKIAPPLLPEPRSYAGTAIVFGALTALPFAILWTWLVAAMQQQSFGQILPSGAVAPFPGIMRQFEGFHLWHVYNLAL